MNPPFDQLRLTDAERDAAVAALGEHYAVGRLTKLEYDERAQAAQMARTRGELAPLFADLPVPATDVSQQVERRAAPHRHHYVGPVPLLPIIIALIALTVITHLPFIVFGLLVWFVLARMSGRAWAHPGRRRGWR